MSKILIIEKESVIINVIQNNLKEKDKKYKVDVAEDGEIGLNKIKETDYDLIICDIKMPKKDGVEVMEESLEFNPDLTFVMISGHGDIDTAVDCIKKDAFDYMSKSSYF